MDDSVTFQDWLKQRRKALDLTQEELAERIGCSDVTIRKIESGQRRPSKQIAVLIARFFGIPIENLDAFILFARGLGTEITLAVPARPGLGPEHELAADQEPAGREWEAEPPPLAGIQSLPVPLTPLIGREAAVALACSRLLRNDVRLLTLTGPPGIGKTRLAIEVAVALADQFIDGLFFVALAPVTDPRLVTAVIARTLGVKEAGGRSLELSLAHFLRGRQSLLLLDNFEQVVEAATSVAALLAGCPHLKVLVTSREVLHIYGEQQFAVSPLALPTMLPLPSVEELGSYPAISLFLDRAQAVNPAFTLTHENAPQVAALCARLEGLPLAIELASGWIHVLSPGEIYARLQGPEPAKEEPAASTSSGQALRGAKGNKDEGRVSRLKLLTSRARDLSPRQQTLRGAIEWSYNLLAPGERTLFSRLGVFVGGCTLSAVEAVCNAKGDLPISMLEGLASLVDKSLVKRQGTGLEGESHFSMLETIREYAAERLEDSNESARIKRLHAEYYLALAELASLHMESPEQATWLVQLEGEHDNMRAALDWCLHPEGELQLALRLAIALAPFWAVHGHFREGREWLSRVLSRREGAYAPGSAPLWAQAYARAGRFAFRQSDYPAARSSYEESLAICRELGDERGVARALMGLGNVATEEGDYPAASRFYEESLAINRVVGDSLSTADCLIAFAWTGLRQGDYTLATRRFDEALALCRQMGHKEEAAFALSGLGEVAVRQGEYTRASALLEESLVLRRELGDKWGIAISLGTIGWAALLQGDYDRATALLRESILLRAELKDKGGVAWCLERFAEIAKERERLERAVRLCSAAHALRQSVGSVMDPADHANYENNIAAAQAALGHEAFTKIWEQAHVAALDEIIPYAIEAEASC